MLAAFDTGVNRVENTPKREQEFQDISRDYDSTREAHQSLVKRYEEAQVSESMEQRQKGEQFRILDPALPSTVTTAPNRLRLLMMAFALSAGLAAGVAMLAEMFDTSFHSADEVRAFTRVPVLLSISRIATEADRRRRRLRFRLAAGGALLGLALVAGASFLVARGNEQMVRMLEVADEAVADAARERDRPHHSVAFQRSAHPRVCATLSEVSSCEMGRRLEVIGGRAGYEVHRAADGVPSIQRALRPSKHFDALEIEKPRERHRRPGEVHAVEIDRRTGIRSGKHRVCADPANRELAPAGILRKRHRGGQRWRPFNGLGSEAAEVGSRDSGDRHRYRLHGVLAQLRTRDDRFFDEGDVQGKGYGDAFTRLHSHGTPRALESAQLC
jgi:hypothetical protein